jgi:hypothetical protein
MTSAGEKSLLTDAMDFTSATVHFVRERVNPFQWRGDEYRLLPNGDIERLVPEPEPLRGVSYRRDDPLDLENCHALTYQNEQSATIERLREALRRISRTPITSDCQKIAREALGE